MALARGSRPKLGRTEFAIDADGFAVGPEPELWLGRWLAADAAVAALERFFVAGQTSSLLPSQLVTQRPSALGAGSPLA